MYLFILTYIHILIYRFLLIRGSNYLDTLLEYIDRDQIPLEYGGTLEGVGWSNKIEPLQDMESILGSESGISVSGQSAVGLNRTDKTLVNSKSNSTGSGVNASITTGKNSGGGELQNKLLHTNSNGTRPSMIRNKDGLKTVKRVLFAADVMNDKTSTAPSWRTQDHNDALRIRQALAISGGSGVLDHTSNIKLLWGRYYWVYDAASKYVSNKSAVRMMIMCTVLIMYVISYTVLKYIFGEERWQVYNMDTVIQLMFLLSVCQCIFLFRLFSNTIQTIDNWVCG